MENFIKENWKKILGGVILVVAVFLIYSFSSKNSPTTEPAQNSQEQGSAFSPLSAQEKKDFFGKYDLFYFDKEQNLTKNGNKIEKGGEKFDADTLYSDGSFLASYSEVLNKVGTAKAPLTEVMDSSVALNDYKLFFQGNIYDSHDFSPSVLKDQNFIYYLKCLKIEYNQKSNGNRCVKTALYANNNKIDEADLLTDVEISVGVSNIEPLFVKNGIFYYIKTIGEKSDFYSYNSTNKKVTLFRPELFGDNQNELLGILDNGDVIFSNSNGIFRNNPQSKIIDITQFGGNFLKGIAVGNSYYYFNPRYNSQNNDGGHDLFKDSLLIAKIHSSVFGRMIDPENQDCHFSNYIMGYPTLMYCINKEGTIVRLDSKISDKTNSKKGTIDQPDYGVAYVVNNDVVDFSPYWKTDEIKNIQSVSFIFDENGGVSNLVVGATNQDYTSSIFLLPYLGGGQIGTPRMLVSNATFFGVAKK